MDKLRKGSVSTCYNSRDMQALDTHPNMVAPWLRWVAALLLLFLGMATSGFGPPPGANPTPTDSERLTQSELAILRASPEPMLTARSAVLIDPGTGRVLWGKAPDRRLPIASTTKMMTALLAAELADPDEVATVYPRDLVLGSTVSLREGERLTIEQLLYGALIQSGNDAAVTIADHVGREYLGGVGDDGIDTFVRAMNARARKMGLTNTQFKNPNGFDAPGHYSTARDLAVLGREVLANPLLAGIVATAQYRMTGYLTVGRERTPVYHPVRTTNELLRSYRGANGIKTGTTPQAGEALVASVQRGDASLIAVMLGATDRFADARALFDWGFDRYEWLPITPYVFDSPVGTVALQQPLFAAVEKWNIDLPFFNAGAGAARYWVGTEPLEIPPSATGAP